ncbi:hypothetical protein KQI22_00805 [Kineothrix sp. MSJ-39]|uniref:hypothetical protein n=1 Tax=Kineothrix sp. MSJ-39 TaxID=2841533 RepID=UPI001C126527|nr:hypothetical protein [Kineothrix sp. MSJ-39]MBU5428603.1 hypothetical protein [Kineothrix sp. MSJ-39]
MFFLHKWEKNLESDIDCMEASMQPYIALFYAFRKIRHDFANYVQTLQLFAETENYDEKKKMKKEILGQIERFYENVPKDAPYFPAFPAKASRNAYGSAIYEAWSVIRQGMEKLPATICEMLGPLQKLQDQLERSLDPDESETEELFSGLDRFRSLPMEASPALSVLMDLCMQEAEQKGCLLRYKICRPTCFQMAYPDMLLLYRQVFLLALSGAGQSGGKSGKERKTILLRSAEKFDMWHLHLEYPCAEKAQGNLPKVQKTPQYRCIRKLAKTYKLQLKSVQTPEGISLDLTR